jgi:hypothetical protein
MTFTKFSEEGLAADNMPFFISDMFGGAEFPIKTA